MRRQLLATSALSSILVSSAAAQAPAGADLWRVAGATLATPPPLVSGATGLLWNPAAPAPEYAVGVEVIQTGSVVGLSGLSAGAQTKVGGRLELGLVFGRMQVRDLVRTTTSPNSEVGSIPVHEQFVGGKVGIRAAWFEVATLLRFHDERFDALGAQGFTFDFGVYAEPWSVARFAAATHFLALDFSTQHTTDFYLAGEVEPLRPNLLRDTNWRLFGRYGITLRSLFGPDHVLSAGARYHNLLSFDLSMTREAGFEGGAWRPGISFALRIGRYTIGAARGSGLNDVSGTYRISMNVQLR